MGETWGLDGGKGGTVAESVGGARAGWVLKSLGAEPSWTSWDSGVGGGHFSLSSG